MADRKPIPTDIPEGFCHCGCGGATNSASKTCRAQNMVKGRPFIFIRGHGSRMQVAAMPIPERRQCACGCGAWIEPNRNHRYHHSIYKPGHNPASEATRALWRQQRKGVRLPPETVAKIAAKNRGKKRSPETCAKIARINQNRSPEWCRKLAEARTGARNVNWKGGVTPLRLKRSYLHWRQRVLDRDGHACQRCGIRQEVGLHAHHKIPISERPDLAMELDNAVTLCHSCHILTERAERLARKAAR
jgi:hypothetical protein